MINGRLERESTKDCNVSKILKLAKRSHENYLVRSSEKDLDEAILYYLKAIKIDPSISEVYYKLAGLLWERGEIDIDSAMEQCDKAISLDPKCYKRQIISGIFSKSGRELSGSRSSI